MQVLGPAAAASRRKPSCGVKPARRGLAEVGGVPLWVRGEALQVHQRAWLSWPPSHRVTFPSREEEFSHRLTQQGSLSQRGEVSTAPPARTSEECDAK